MISRGADPSSTRPRCGRSYRNRASEWVIRQEVCERDVSRVGAAKLFGSGAILFVAGADRSVTVRNLLSCLLKPWGNVTIRPDTHNRQRSAHLAILRDTDSDNRERSTAKTTAVSISLMPRARDQPKQPAATTFWVELERDPAMARPDFHAVSRLAIERTAEGWRSDLRKRRPSARRRTERQSRSEPSAWPRPTIPLMPCRRQHTRQPHARTDLRHVDLIVET